MAAFGRNTTQWTSPLREGVVASTSVRSRILGRDGSAMDETIRRQMSRFQDMPELRGLLDALPHPILILNAEARIVFANRHVLSVLGVSQGNNVFGLLPGDVLDCGHAQTNGPGCGRNDACRLCGAHRAFSLGTRGDVSTQECRITQAGGTSLDLRATATPLTLAGEAFTVLALTDISDEKRRKVLERVFFHDLLNLTAGIMGYSELLARVPPGEVPEIGRLLARMVRELAEEIRSQRDLALAEALDLKVQWEPVSSHAVLTAVTESCGQLEAAEDRTIVLDANAADVTFPSDKSLLARVLANLLKNALEASDPGHTVTLGCRAHAETVDFWVHNDGFMPRDVQLQVFQRSFSTRGANRGLGTYSIRLLTERYLRGRASFTSTPEAGTMFTVSYPRTRQESA